MPGSAAAVFEGAGPPREPLPLRAPVLVIVNAEAARDGFGPRCCVDWLDAEELLPLLIPPVPAGADAAAVVVGGNPPPTTPMAALLRRPSTVPSSARTFVGAFSPSISAIMSPRTSSEIGSRTHAPSRYVGTVCRALDVSL